MMAASPELRFWRHVDRRDPDWCWLWTGARTFGYGCFSLGSRSVRAHRFSYEMLVGPIPEGLTIDHLCRNRACVNPKHLEPVTNRENVLRGNGLPALNARKTHCKRGHAFTPENTIRTGRRNCRECHRNDRARQRKATGGEEG